MNYCYLDLNTFDYGIYFEEQNENDNLIEIDENIVHVISILNKKGYKTLNCCEGHYSKLINEEAACIDYPYISFDDGIELPCIPYGWKMDVDDYIIEEDEDGNDKVIGGNFKSIMANIPEEVETGLDFYTAKSLALFALYTWANNLKNIGE